MPWPCCSVKPVCAFPLAISTAVFSNQLARTIVEKAINKFLKIGIVGSEDRNQVIGGIGIASHGHRHGCSSDNGSSGRHRIDIYIGSNIPVRMVRNLGRKFVIKSR
jgi:hypothetical protein